MGRYSRLQHLASELTRHDATTRGRELRRAIAEGDPRDAQAARLVEFVAVASVVSEGDPTADASNADLPLHAAD